MNFSQVMECTLSEDIQNNSYETEDIGAIERAYKVSDSNMDIMFLMGEQVLPSKIWLLEEDVGPNYHRLSSPKLSMFPHYVKQKGPLGG